MQDLSNYLENNKQIYDALLDFIDDEKNPQNKYQDLERILNDQKIIENQHETLLLLHLLVKLSINHRSSDLLAKIEQILLYFKKAITDNFSNYEIFNIFKGNKKILLFLIEEKMIVVDKSIAAKLTNEKYKERKYHLFFYPEIKSFLDDSMIANISSKVPEDIEEKRKNDNFDNYIAQLIQKDSIDEFVTYINKKNISIEDSIIDQSITEINSFLFSQTPTLIEYAVFCGSIQIFKYLQLNNVELSESLWTYSMYGRTPDIIHILEENKVNPPKKSYKDCFCVSIKCHHNEISNYLRDTYLEENIDKIDNLADQCLKYYNFDFIQIEYLSSNNFWFLCKYDYYEIVENLLNGEKFDVNKKNVYILCFLIMLHQFLRNILFIKHHYRLLLKKEI